MFSAAGGLFFFTPSLHQLSPLSQVIQKSCCILAEASIQHSVNPKQNLMSMIFWQWKPQLDQLEGTSLSQLSITIPSMAINVQMGANRSHDETLAAQR